jgi:hypothetical protein
MNGNEMSNQGSFNGNADGSLGPSENVFKKFGISHIPN